MPFPPPGISAVNPQPYPSPHHHNFRLHPISLPSELYSSLALPFYRSSDRSGCLASAHHFLFIFCNTITVSRLIVSDRSASCSPKIASAKDILALSPFRVHFCFPFVYSRIKGTQSFLFSLSFEPINKRAAPKTYTLLPNSSRKCSWTL